MVAVFPALSNWAEVCRPFGPGNQSLPMRAAGGVPVCGARASGNIQSARLALALHAAEPAREREYRGNLTLLLRQIRPLPDTVFTMEVLQNQRHAT